MSKGPRLGRCSSPGPRLQTRGAPGALQPGAPRAPQPVGTPPGAAGDTRHSLSPPFHGHSVPRARRSLSPPILFSRVWLEFQWDSGMCLFSQRPPLCQWCRRTGFPLPSQNEDQRGPQCPRVWALGTVRAAGRSPELLQARQEGQGWGQERHPTYPDFPEGPSPQMSTDRDLQHNSIWNNAWLLTESRAVIQSRCSADTLNRESGVEQRV